MEKEFEYQTGVVLTVCTGINKNKEAKCGCCAKWDLNFCSTPSVGGKFMFASVKDYLDTKTMKKHKSHVMSMNLGLVAA